MATENDDIFASTFALLIGSLEGGQRESATFAQHKYLNYCISQKSNKHSFVKTIACQIIDEYVINHHSINSRIAQITATCKHYLNSCHIQSALIRNRLSQQQLRAERRLKELIFEVIGEYTKSKTRFIKRQAYLHNDSNAKVALEVWKLRWDRYCLKLEHDLLETLPNKSPALRPVSGLIKCRQLTVEKDHAEIDYVVQKVSKRYGLVSTDSVALMTVVKITVKQQSNKPTTTAPNPSAAGFTMAENSADMTLLTRTMSAWVASHVGRSPMVHTAQAPRGMTPNGARDGGRQLASNNHSSSHSALSQLPADTRPPEHQLLSIRGVEWLHPSSCHPQLWSAAKLLNSVQTGARRSTDTAEVPHSTDRDIEELNDFARIFAQQHSSSLFNDRVYYCLELCATTSDSSGSSAVGALHSALQAFYVESLLSEDTAEALALGEIAATMIGFCDGHRDITSTSRLLASFPDIVRARLSGSGAVVHFAPAALFHLALNRRADTQTGTQTKPSCPLFCAVLPTTLSTGGSGESGSERFMSPLTVAALSALLRYYKVDEPNQQQSDLFMTEATTATAAAASDTTSEQRVYASFDLLPDSALERSALSSSTNTVSEGFNGLSLQNRRLRHQYIVLSDENTFSARDTKTPAAQPCVYLIQAYGNDANVSRTDADQHMQTLVTRYYEEAKLKNGTAIPIPSKTSIVTAGAAVNIGAGANSSNNDVSISGSRKSSKGVRGTQQQHPQVASSDAADSPVPSTSGGKRSWDPQVLSTMCRWRSCLCETPVSQHGQTHPLCVYHEELRRYVDNRGGHSAKSSQSSVNGPESAKYLPRKAPNFGTSSAAPSLDPDKRDSLMIRAASTLLQELWDGKLGHTVHSFSKKMCHNMALRGYLTASVPAFAACYPDHYALRQNNNNPAAIIPAPPTWSRWKDKAQLERVTASQNESIEALQAILQIEAAVTQELSELAELGVFPTAELAMIRKEMRAFKEHQDLVVAKADASASLASLVNTDNVSVRKTDKEHKEVLAALGGGTAYDDLLSLLETERRVSERKLSLLSIRRQEEAENAQQVARKIAKARQTAEESNNTRGRDSASFKNQTRF